MASKKKNPAKTPAAKKTAKSSKVTRAEAAPPAQAEGKRLSALDAAAKVLAETGQPLRCTELIAAMAAKGYWTSPGGKTPASTLYAALLRELKTKKDQARFRKTQRGKFGLA
jgi:hypothetical protein